MLSLNYVPYPHTGLVTKDLLLNELNKWNLSNKIVAITTDNGSNIVSSIKKLKQTLELDRVSCAAHTLQLTVKKALNANDDIKILILRVKKLISFFSSPKQLQALEKEEKAIGLTKNLLLNDEFIRFVCMSFPHKKVLE